MTSNRLQNFSLFSYGWAYEDEDTNQGLQTIIKIYGWNERNESVYVRVEDFYIPVYIELPDYIEWDDNNIMAVSNRLQSLNPNPHLRPKAICFERKQRTYYAYVNNTNSKSG